MKKAFTLIEVVICITILGIIAIVMLKSISDQNFNEKEYALKAHKAIRLIDEASAQIIQSESEWLPTGAFMTKSTGSWEYAVCTAPSSCTTLASSSQIINLFRRYIKFENTYPGTYKNFYTGYDIPDGSSGGIIQGKIYVGFENNANNTIKACPDEVYIPTSEQKNGTDFVVSSTIDTSNKNCWGKVYIDTNGNKGPNELGKDIYVFGMGEFGIVK